jgi:DNA processing protein
MDNDFPKQNDLHNNASTQPTTHTTTHAPYGIFDASPRMPPLQELPKTSFPVQLLEIPQPPKKIYFRSNNSLSDLLANKKILTIVGPRKHTNYAEDCIRSLVGSLKGMPVVIVSGLAYGIDSIAHAAAIEAGLTTIAFPGSGLNEDVIYPRLHVNLAQRILDSGGALISECRPNQKAADWIFPQRNRLVAGIAHAILIPEAGEKSGTLITARLAVDYNRDLLVIPGNINNPLSKGTNQFLRLGAVPITCADDLREALGFPRSEDTAGSSQATSHNERTDLSAHEKKLLELLTEPKSRNDLAQELSVSISEINMVITLLEIKELIKEQNGLIRPS